MVWSSREPNRQAHQVTNASSSQAFGGKFEKKRRCAHHSAGACTAGMCFLRRLRATPARRVRRATHVRRGVPCKTKVRVAAVCIAPLPLLITDKGGRQVWREMTRRRAGCTGGCNANKYSLRSFEQGWRDESAEQSGSMHVATFCLFYSCLLSMGVLFS